MYWKPRSQRTAVLDEEEEEKEKKKKKKKKKTLRLSDKIVIYIIFSYCGFYSTILKIIRLFLLC
jgi:hypothetical protein